MKKMFFVAVVLFGLTMIIVAADVRRIPAFLEDPPVDRCAGYTIIEYDKGIDCRGDTIRLMRRNGFAERVMLTDDR